MEAATEPKKVRAACPHCGSTNLGTNEDLSGTADLIDGVWLVGENGDETEYEFGGTTTVHWDSSSTQGFTCLDCYSDIDFGELVPEKNDDEGDDDGGE